MKIWNDIIKPGNFITSFCSLWDLQFHNYIILLSQILIILPLSA